MPCPDLFKSHSLLLLGVSLCSPGFYAVRIKLSGQSYEQRRQWIEDKLYDLAQIFVLDLCTYTLMSNHYHVVLPIDAAQAEIWSRDEIITR